MWFFLCNYFKQLSASLRSHTSPLPSVNACATFRAACLAMRCEATSTKKLHSVTAPLGGLYLPQSKMRPLSNKRPASYCVNCFTLDSAKSKIDEVPKITKITKLGPQEPVAPSMVSANHWLNSIKTNRCRGI